MPPKKKDNLNEKAYAFVSDLLARGELDTERMARILLDEFRAGKLGRFTLETVGEEMS